MSDFYYFYNQHLVICNKICLQTCFTNFWKGKLLKIRKQSFHMQNKFPLLFLEILTNPNTNKCCQIFLTFLKRYQKCFMFKKYGLLDSCHQQLVVVPALFEGNPLVNPQTLNCLNGRRHLSSLVQRTASWKDPFQQLVHILNLCRSLFPSNSQYLDLPCYHQWTHPMLFHPCWIEWLLPRYLMDVLLVAPRHVCYSKLWHVWDKQFGCTTIFQNVLKLVQEFGVFFNFRFTGEFFKDWFPSYWLMKL